MENQDQAPAQPLDPETLRRALKAFKKRLKLTALDEDSRLGRGPFSGGSTGVVAVRPPDQYPLEVWEELCRQGKLRRSGSGLYELRPDNNR
ncbi:MAG: hypothetical protein LLF76_09330 [Planctomycetaceae bacterium]|nr:hypothetical protein [Planctomycetaceae bacterium]